MTLLFAAVQGSVNAFFQIAFRCSKIGERV